METNEEYYTEEDQGSEKDKVVDLQVFFTSGGLARLVEYDDTLVSMGMDGINFSRIVWSGPEHIV